MGSWVWDHDFVRMMYLRKQIFSSISLLKHWLFNRDPYDLEVSNWVVSNWVATKSLVLEEYFVVQSTTGVEVQSRTGVVLCSTE